MADTSATPAPAPTPDDNRSRRSPYNQKILAYASTSAIFLQTAQTDPEIRPLIEARGCDDAEFIEGETLIAAVNSSITGRAEGLGQKSDAVRISQAAQKAARDHYAQFRQIARSNFASDGARLALSLRGDVPEGLNTFRTTARASYTAGQNDPYTAQLSKRGYTPAILTGLIEELTALGSVESSEDSAQGDAIADTGARDLAYQGLKAFMQEFRGTVKGALRGQPGLLAKLGF